MKAAGLRHANLERMSRETGEIVLVIPAKDFRDLHAAVAAGVSAQPRKATFRRLLDRLEEVAAW